MKSRNDTKEFLTIKPFVTALIALASVALASGTATVPAIASAPAIAPVAAVTTCQEQFDLLKADTEFVEITGGKVDKERAGLLKLIEDAEALAALGKTDDATKKLLDSEVKIDQLEAAGRISADSAAQLRADAQATIACLQSSGV